jgi:hypothetical protein
VSGDLLPATNTDVIAALAHVNYRDTNHLRRLRERLGIQNDDIQAYLDDNKMTEAELYGHNDETEADEEGDEDDYLYAIPSSYTRPQEFHSLLPFRTNASTSSERNDGGSDPVIYTDATTTERVGVFVRLLLLRRPLLRWKDVVTQTEIYTNLNKVVCHVSTHMCSQLT